MNPCFECDKPADHDHHVIPKSLGGTKTVPLCGECHAKVHQVRSVGTSKLTRLGMAKAKARGVKFGPKPTVDHDRVFALRRLGMSGAAIGAALGIECRNTIYSILERKGWLTCDPDPVLPMFKDGLSPRAIARRKKLNESFVVKLLKETTHLTEITAGTKWSNPMEQNNNLLSPP